MALPRMLRRYLRIEHGRRGRPPCLPGLRIIMGCVVAAWATTVGRPYNNIGGVAFAEMV